VRQVLKKREADPPNRFLSEEGHGDYDVVRVGQLEKLIDVEEVLSVIRVATSLSDCDLMETIVAEKVI